MKAEISSNADFVGSLSRYADIPSAIAQIAPILPVGETEASVSLPSHPFRSRPSGAPKLTIVLPHDSYAAKAV